MSDSVDDDSYDSDIVEGGDDGGGGGGGGGGGVVNIECNVVGHDLTKRWKMATRKDGTEVYRCKQCCKDMDNMRKMRRLEQAAYEVEFTRYCKRCECTCAHYVKSNRCKRCTYDKNHEQVERRRKTPSPGCAHNLHVEGKWPVKDAEKMVAKSLGLQGGPCNVCDREYQSQKRKERRHAQKEKESSADEAAALASSMPESAKCSQTILDLLASKPAPSDDQIERVAEVLAHNLIALRGDRDAWTIRDLVPSVAAQTYDLRLSATRQRIHNALIAGTWPIAESVRVRAKIEDADETQVSETEVRAAFDRKTAAPQDIDAREDYYRKAFAHLFYTSPLFVERRKMTTLRIIIAHFNEHCKTFRKTGVFPQTACDGATAVCDFVGLILSAANSLQQKYRKDDADAAKAAKDEAEFSIPASAPAAVMAATTTADSLRKKFGLLRR